MTSTIKPFDHRVSHKAFTLVELLVVIVLMSILSGMMAFALAGARQDARYKRAQAEARAITVILQQKINDISLAPVSFVAPVDGAAVSSSPVSSGVEQNRVNMLARRDMMRMVLPQCRADLIYPPARLQFRYAANPSAPTTITPSSIKVKLPNEWSQMRRLAGFAFPSGADIEASAPPALALDVFSDSSIDSVGVYFGTSPAHQNLRNALGLLRGHTIDLNDATAAPWPFDPAVGVPGETWTREYESAECLYLILASTELYGERALDQFSSRSIANLDGDAVPEIIDPWGVPYEFIRDPVGREFKEAVLAAPTSPHPNGADPQDYLRTDFRFANNVSSVPPNDPTNVPYGPMDDPYKLAPLVISAGADGVFGIRRVFDPDGDFASDTMGVSPRYSTAITTFSASPVAPSMAGNYQYPDPYAQRRSGSSAPFAATVDDFATAAAELPAATIAAWSFDANGPGGVGLGAALLQSPEATIDAFADDIASDGAQ